MKDVIYCGYSTDGFQCRGDFLKELRDTYKGFERLHIEHFSDPIKGVKILITVPDEETDNYYSWLIAYGVFEISLNFQLIMRDKEKRDVFDRVFALSQEQYPDNFKKDRE